MGEGVREEPQDSSKDDGIQGGRPRVVGGTVNVDFIAQRWNTPWSGAQDYMCECVSTQEPPWAGRAHHILLPRGMWGIMK